MLRASCTFGITLSLLACSGDRPAFGGDDTPVDSPTTDASPRRPAAPSRDAGRASAQAAPPPQQEPNASTTSEQTEQTDLQEASDAEAKPECTNTDSDCKQACNQGFLLCGESCIAETACCADSDCPAGTECVGTECVDTRAPRVQMISPVGGAAGVRADAAVVIEFSEEMNRDSVLASLSISTIAFGNLDFSWNDDGTTLTVIPIGGLLYGAGTSTRFTPPRTYTVTLAETARDITGNELNAAFSSSFATLRRISTSLLPTSAGYQSSYSAAIGGRPSLCPLLEGLRLGTFTSNGGYSGKYSVYATFDATDLAELKLVEQVEKATFVAVQTSADTGFYPNASILLKQIEYGPIEPASRLSPVQAELPPLATSFKKRNTSDITQAFWSEWSAGKPKQLFLITAELEPQNVHVQLDCEGLAIETTFLVQ